MVGLFHNGSFGERVAEYDVPVLNEREVRASAGILFVFALLAFASAWFTGDFRATKLFVIAFWVDMAIRLFLSPRYAPVLVLGRFAVRNQVPEYTGAAQKKFAWFIGLALATFMLVWLVGLNMLGPVNMLTCLTCLTLLFMESSFGFCLGCEVYNKVWPGRAQLCAGGQCEAKMRQPIQHISGWQIGMVGLFSALLVGLVRSPLMDATPARQQSVSTEQAASCKAPDWAVSMGHEEMWKKHNGCQ